MVAAFRAGTGMGELFQEYGRPAMLGVGHVREDFPGKGNPFAEGEGSERPLPPGHARRSDEDEHPGQGHAYGRTDNPGRGHGRGTE